MTNNTAEAGELAAEGGRSAGWPQGLLLAMQAMLPTMGAVMLVPVVPLLIKEFGSSAASPYLIPAILTVPALCIALLAWLAGWLGDRLGRRALLIGALCLYGLAGAAPILISGVTGVIASRVALGICEAVIITLSATLIGDYFIGRERARWLAMISTIASLSAVVFMGLGGAIGAAYGWRWVTAIYGLSILFVPAMLLLTWEPKNQASTAPASIQAASATNEAFPWRHMVITGIASLFGGILFFALAVHQGTALTALGVQDPARAGLLTAVASIANPIGTVVFWRVSHWRPAVLLALEFAIIGAACSVIAFVQTDVQFAAVAFIGLFGCGLLMPTLITWTMAALPFSGRARGTGIFQSLFLFAQFASGMLLAYLTTSLTGNQLKSYGLLGAVALVVAAYCMVNSKRQQQR